MTRMGVDPNAPPGKVVSTGWPSWRYGPNNQAKVFQRAEDVPAGWADHPSKVAPRMYPDDGGLKEPVRAFEDTFSAAEVVKEHFGIVDPAAPPATDGQCSFSDEKPSLAPALTRKQITDALTARKILFSKNTPTPQLYEKLLAAVEKSEA
jgi:hypothetical protein